METFYIIVLSIAVIFYIIIITLFGLLMTKSETVTPFPPMKNSCPDYWSSETDASGKVLCRPNSSINTIDITGLPGSNGGSVDFTDVEWGAKSGKSNMCALNSWAIRNNISWDGVSNFNGC
jgi:hypothetical protein